MEKLIGKVLDLKTPKGVDIPQEKIRESKSNRNNSEITNCLDCCGICENH